MVETNALDKGVGVVLQQDGHTIAYVSKALRTKSQWLSTYEKECFAILMVVDHWRAYLQQGEFILRTNQKSLIDLDDQRITSPWKQNVLRKLMGLNFQIVYKKRVWQ